MHISRQKLQADKTKVEKLIVTLTNAVKQEV